MIALGFRLRSRLTLLFCLVSRGRINAMVIFRIDIMVRRKIWGMARMMIRIKVGV